MAATQPPYDINAVLQHTNAYRDIHQARGVVHDPSISQISQAWANHLVSKKLFQHNSAVNSRGYGENLAQTTWWGSSADTSTVITAQVNHLIDLWYNEISLYNYRNPVFSMKTGHFTQLVWQSTTKVGVGVAIANGNLCLVMNYDPPGNYKGQFQSNVLPAKPVAPINNQQPVYQAGRILESLAPGRLNQTRAGQPGHTPSDRSQEHRSQSATPRRMGWRCWLCT